MTPRPQLRITVNSRCGRACFFCRPSGEALATRPGARLTMDAVLAVASAFAAAGIQEIKLTGGDPALWPPLVETVRKLKRELAIPTVHVISRHPKIAAAAAGLHAAGLDQLNLSIDTLRRDLHRTITGVDDLPELLDALRACVQSGLPVKVNTVVMKRVNSDELPGLLGYFETAGVSEVKFLDVIQDLDSGTEGYQERLKLLGVGSLAALYAPLDELDRALSAKATERKIIMQGGLGHPMVRLTLPSGMRVTLKDRNAGAWYGSVCKACPHRPCHDALMSVRLTADLRLQFCLLREDIAVDIRDVIAGGSGALAPIIDKVLDVYAHARFHEPVHGGIRT